VLVSESSWFDAVINSITICAQSMHPLSSMIDTSLVINFDVMSIKKDDTNNQQKYHQDFKAVNPIAVTHDLKPPDNHRF
jgi:hypothetical protein